MGGPKERRIIIVKNWQIAVGILTLAGQILFAYATMDARNDENSRRIRDLEQKHFVDWDTFNNYQKGLESQLNRIEGKIEKTP
jgi:hypothetical protein